MLTWKIIGVSEISVIYICIYRLANQILEQSLTLPFFFLSFSNFITKSNYNTVNTHTHKTNLLSFLIIKLYKAILYLCCTHKHPHTLLFTQIIL